MKDDIRKLALRNSIQFGGKANPKAVMASFMATKPVGDKKEILKLIYETVDEVNSISLDEQKKEAESLGVNTEKEKKEQRTGLQNLKDAKMGAVITRAAPNPDGPLHLGNIRAFGLSYMYSKEFKGRFILRFDDTDPRTKRPIKEAYDWIIEDLEWLGAKPDIIVYASDRMNTYYKFAYELIKMKKAYVCDCKIEEWRKLRDQKESCPCRDIKADESIQKWHDFLSKYKEGQGVLRVKTDMKHKDPAMRDWPAMRIIENANHPRVGYDYRAWPLYNLASSIDDHELGVSHVLRAQEHSVNTQKQKYIFDYFNWHYPTTIHHGKLSIDGIVLSKSKTTKGIEDGIYTGFDDPRLGSIRALKRRGFRAQAIMDFIRDIGSNPNDIKIDIKNLSSYNRKLLDFESDRYFFVSNPVEVKLKDSPKKQVSVPLHPEEDRGNRKIQVTESIFIEKEDYEKSNGSTIRLKGLFNVNLSDGSYAGNDIVKEMAKVQWVPKNGVKLKIIMPDATEITGTAEPGITATTENDVIQLERFGFVRIDCKDPLTAYFAHK